MSTRSKLRGSAAVLSTAALVAASVVVAAPAMAAPPTNDNFPGQTITGTTGQVFGTNVDATGQTGEPRVAGLGPTASIWYTWVAPSAAAVSFDTCSSDDFDTLLGVYTGSAVNALTTVISNDDDTVVCPNTSQSRVTFTPVSGTTYRIQVDGYEGDEGLTALTWTTTGVAPANDTFANATTLSGTSGTVNGTTVGATRQPGEPVNFGPGPIRSVWYKITPATSGTLSVDLCASPAFDSVIGVYTGAAVGSLTRRDDDDDGCGTLAGPSRITGLPVTAGTTYSISVDGYGGIWGPFTLAYSLVGGGPTPPANDNFANAITISGTSGSVTGTTVNATAEPGEPLIAGLGPQKSVWYTWTAPSSGTATFGLCTGTTFDTIHAAYTGTAVNALTSRGSADDTSGCGNGSQGRFSFSATAGTAYKIQVDGYATSVGNAPTGTFTLTYSLAVPLTLSIDDVTLNEGNAGTTNFTFTATLSAASASTVTVNYATANGTATTPSDYASTSGTLTFTPGQTTRTVTVAVVGDVTFEPTETFVVNLTAPTGGATIADAQGIGTISNDDNQPAVSIGDVTQVEGDSGSTTFTFPVTLSNPSATAVTMSYATANGTATSPSDYTATSGSLTFNPGETTKNISVTVSGDTLFEANETFRVNLSGLSGATFSDDLAVGTISNDDATPTLSIDDVVLDEGDSGTTSFTFTVELSSASGEPVTVDYSSSDASATAPADYEGVSGTLTFNPGQTTKTVTVLVNGDSTYEADETFTVELAAAAGAGIADSSGLGTITNDDAAPTFAIDDVTGTEGDAGTTEFAFTVTRTGDTELPSTVDYSTADGTAESPADYAATSGTLTFGAGDTTATVTVEVNGDAIDELAETFMVNLAGATGATIADDEGVGTITDDDAAPGVTIDDVSQVELDGAAESNFNFTVSLSRPSSRTVTVQFDTIDGTASDSSDYLAQSGTLVFEPGETTQVATVTVYGDGTDEADETFFVDLSNAVRATIADSRAVGTILNDDGQASLSVDDVTHAEGDSGTTAYRFTVSLTGSTALVATVNYDTNNGTATAPGDYTATNGTLTFLPGQTSQQVTVQVNGDTTYEDDEEFTLHLSGAVGATIADANGTGAITNDDPFPELTIADASDDEGTGGQTPFVFDVTLSNPSEQTISVDYATADGTATSPADYATRTGTLTFTPGQTTKTITVPVVGDATYEDDEQFNVQLANALNVSLADADAVGSISDDDGPPSFTINDVTHVEGDSGTTSYEFTVTKTGATALAATVSYATADGTATAGEDYAAVSGTMTFAPGESSKTVTVEVNGDLTFEADETFSVLLTAPADATIGDGTGTGTVGNDDTEPTVSIGNKTQAEGDTGTGTFTFDVTLSNPSSETVTVEVDTADGTATAPSDYTTGGGTVTFAPGEVTKTFTVSVKGDVVFEGNETFTVELSAANNATIADGTGTGTITNDDNQPVISITDDQVIEGNAGTRTATFTVALTNPSAQTITVDYATADDSAEEPGDYTGTTGTLTFGPGQLSQSIAVTVRGDTAFETDETFDVVLSAPVRATISDGTGLGTITNDDLAPTISVADAIVTEGNSGTQPLEFQVTLSNASYQTVSVGWAASNGSAVAPGDYAPLTGTVTFNPGQTTKSFTVQAKGDVIYENDEIVNVDLGVATNGAVADAHADGIIDNDDAPPTISIENATRPEGDSGTTNFGFTVNLTGASEVDATVDYTTTDGTATAPGDYEETTGSLEIKAGDTTASVDVAVKGDTALEPDETFTVTLSGADRATIGDGSGLGTITNDDAAAVDLGLVLTDSPDPVRVGANLTYQLTVTNAGGTAATDVVVTDTLPVGPTFGSATASQGSCVGTATVTCSLGTIAPAASATVTIVVTSTRTGTYLNTASVTATETDPDLSDNQATEQTTVIANAAGCTILGTAANDTITGSAGNDVICGGSGNDRISGLGGSDQLRGQDGNDIMAGGPGNDTLDGADGSDTVSYDADPVGVTVSLTTGSATDGYGDTDTLVSIKSVRGSGLADTIEGSATADKLLGRGGADVLRGFAGNDVLNGGAGTDTGNGGQGTDSCPGVESRQSCESQAAVSGMTVLPSQAELAAERVWLLARR